MRDSSSRHAPRRRWGAVFAAALLGLVAAAGGLLAWIWADLNTATAPESGSVRIAVAPGESFGSLAERLASTGVVRHAWTLRLWARLRGLDRGVRSGDFRFDPPLTPLDVVALLRSGPNAAQRVTIPEGTTVNGIAVLLAAAGFGGADVFQCLLHEPDFLADLDLPGSGAEGYLFPDTYTFEWSTSAEGIVKAMVRRFHEQAEGLRAAREARGMREQEMVTLASLIEKEAAVAAERALVSAVFHNRLRIGMRLQSDPTALYGTAREGTSRPTRADMRVDTPYNTYLHAGLPPGPICNPGRAAIEAAVRPAAVAHLYFVARNDGTHEFTDSLEEHNRAVARYRRTRR